MASIFWNNQGEILANYLEEGGTINGAYYVEELRWLCQGIVRKRREKLTRGILLLQDNASAHTLLQMNAASKSFLIPRILQI